MIGLLSSIAQRLGKQWQKRAFTSNLAKASWTCLRLYLSPAPTAVIDSLKA
ncbi:hypothetical protein [Fervidibacter sp.]